MMMASMQVSSRSISLVVGLPNDAASQKRFQDLNKDYELQPEESLPLINGCTVEVPSDHLDTYLASLPEGATVMRNEPFHPAPEPPSDERQGMDASDLEVGEAETPPAEDTMFSGPVPPQSHPLGWEEARALGLDGRGVTMAVIDSGIYPHADFGDRIKAFKNFSWQGTSTPHDDYGHGTHVAGIAAGDGPVIDGVAPAMSLVGARINTPAEAIKAIDWVIANKESLGIDILNLSLGSKAVLAGHSDPFAQAAQRAIDAGILTVVAAGNEGKNGTEPGSISTPGILQDAITVGAYNTAFTPDLSDDKIWGDSSLGPTFPEGLAKPDLVAPGVSVLSTAAPGSELAKHLPAWGDYVSNWGTSMATPMVGGALGLMLQVNPQLTQKGAREILMKTAIPIDGVDATAQGAGRLNLAAAIEAAKVWNA